MRCAPRRLLRDAVRVAAAGRTDEDYVLGLLRATGILCVYGSGFGMPPEQGTFRIVYLATRRSSRRSTPTSAPLRGTTSNAPADAVPDHSDSPRALIRYMLVGLALTVALAWTLYLVRGALLLVYMSVLVAVGLAPLAGAIERSPVRRLTAAAAMGGDPRSSISVSSAYWWGWGCW